MVKKGIKQNCTCWNSTVPIISTAITFTPTNLPVPHQNMSRRKKNPYLLLTRLGLSPSVKPFRIILS